MKSFYPTKSTNTVLVRDEARYSTIMRAVDALSDTFCFDTYCSMSIRPNEVSETSMTVEFVVGKFKTSCERFTTALALADEMTVTSRDGLTSIKLLFDGLYRRATKVC